MKVAPDAGPAAPLIVDFDDNRLLGALFGEYDRNVARIEQRLGVSVSSRGNRVAISGDSWSRNATRDVLASLYERLKKGLEVEEGDVEGAIRMAREGVCPATAAGVGDEAMIETRKRVISPRSPRQVAYVRAMRTHELVIATGPAGTGKTYLAVAVAVSMLLKGAVDRIVLSRPAVEAGERLGFLPGDLREKIDPYVRPLYDALYHMLPANEVVRRLESGEIEVAPVGFMRGRTLANAFVILDEAQNTRSVQMKMLLTRLGEDSRMVVTGDLTQIDLPAGERSGLADAVEVLDGMEGAAFVHLSDRDVFRHALVTRVIRAYARHERALAGEGKE